MTSLSPNATILAEDFRVLVARGMSPADLATIDRSNVALPPDTCATHDFCDANEVMAGAFAAHGIDSDDVIASPVLTALWNEAWAIARATGFAA